MKLTVCCAYDSKAKAYMLPFYATNLAVALRAFASAANTEGHQVWANPEDFTLFELGTFDDTTGTFDLLPTQINHGLASNVKKEVPLHVSKGA